MHDIERIKIKYVADVFNGNSIPDDKKSDYEGKQIPYIPTKALSVEDGSINYENGLSVDDSDGFRIAPTESVLMCIEGGSAGKKIGFTDRPVAFVNKLCCLHGISMYPKFLYHALRSKDFTDQFFLNMTGLIGGVTVSVLKNLFISTPKNIETQRRISSVIDKKCNEIDSLIANVQAQIEKLKAYKQSLITEVVTKGLDPTVPMKDSGVEWIGEIADTHTMFRLKYLLDSPMQYGANESGNKFTEDSVRYIRITDITADGNLKNDENNQYLPMYTAEGYILKDKDVLFARSGGTVGKSFLYHEEYGPSAFAGYLIKAECDQSSLLPEYLIYYTQSSLYELWKNMIFIQATIQNIGANKYSNMEIPIPSIKEQSTIVELLNAKCAQIDRLISIKQAKIEKLEQYKRSLIYEYVTGKKEVC
jgi:type I restriction enzyme S subunit